MNTLMCVLETFTPREEFFLTVAYIDCCYPFLLETNMAESKKTKSVKNKAVALRYDQESNRAPVVIGKGEGLIAERIIALAREHDIPIHADADLVEILSRLKVNEEIPPETYILVAEILAFIYRANEKYQPEG